MAVPRARVSSERAGRRRSVRWGSGGRTVGRPCGSRSGAVGHAPGLWVTCRACGSRVGPVGHVSGPGAVQRPPRVGGGASDPSSPAGSRPTRVGATFGSDALPAWKRWVSAPVLSLGSRRRAVHRAASEDRGGAPTRLEGADPSGPTGGRRRSGRVGYRRRGETRCRPESLLRFDGVARRWWLAVRSAAASRAYTRAAGSISRPRSRRPRGSPTAPRAPGSVSTAVPAPAGVSPQWASCHARGPPRIDDTSRPWAIGPPRLRPTAPRSGDRGRSGFTWNRTSACPQHLARPFDAHARHLALSCPPDHRVQGTGGRTTRSSSVHGVRGIGAGG